MTTRVRNQIKLLLVLTVTVAVIVCVAIAWRLGPAWLLEKVQVQPGLALIRVEALPGGVLSLPNLLRGQVHVEATGRVHSDAPVTLTLASAPWTAYLGENRFAHGAIRTPLILLPQHDQVVRVEADVDMASLGLSAAQVLSQRFPELRIDIAATGGIGPLHASRSLVLRGFDLRFDVPRPIVGAGGQL